MSREASGDVEITFQADPTFADGSDAPDLSVGPGPIAVPNVDPADGLSEVGTTNADKTPIQAPQVPSQVPSQDPTNIGQGDQNLLVGEDLPTTPAVTAEDLLRLKKEDFAKRIEEAINDPDLSDASLEAFQKFPQFHQAVQSRSDRLIHEQQQREESQRALQDLEKALVTWDDFFEKAEAQGSLNKFLAHPDAREAARFRRNYNQVLDWRDSGKKPIADSPAVWTMQMVANLKTQLAQDPTFQPILDNWDQLTSGADASTFLARLVKTAATHHINVNSNQAAAQAEKLRALNEDYKTKAATQGGVAVMTGNGLPVGNMTYEQFVALPFDKQADVTDAQIDAMWSEHASRHGG